MIGFAGVVAVTLGALFLLTRFGTWLINSRYRHDGQYVTIDGVRVHCVTRGEPHPSQPSFVFVHGASSNHREFMIALGDDLAARFGAHQHVIFVDRPGQGSSDRRAGDHGPDVQAARILAVARKLCAPSVVAVGHSWGGSVVAQMAVDGGAFVAGAVFCAPATHPWPGDRFEGVDWYYAVADRPVLGWLFTRLITLPVAWGQIDEGVENVFAPEPPKPGYAKALGARLVLRPGAFRANAQDVYRLRRFVMREAPRYRTISCPVHIITGDADGVVWAHIHSDGLERDIAGARKITIEGAGHMPHQTHPQIVLDAIADVLSPAAVDAGAQAPARPG